MGKFINPFTDFGFHRIFGQEVHKELLIDFLNQLFFGEHDIEDITFLNPIQTPETLDDRGIVFDVHCKDSNGNLFVVEMQTGAQPISTTGDCTIWRGPSVTKDKKGRTGNSRYNPYTGYSYLITRWT